METSYCGCDQGPYKVIRKLDCLCQSVGLITEGDNYFQGFHLDTNHLQEIGANFCAALTCLHDDKKWKTEMLLGKQDGNK